MQTEIAKNRSGHLNKYCPVKSKIIVGGIFCIECEYFKHITNNFTHCKPPLSLSIMSFLETLKTDKFRRDLLIWLFGFCSGGVFMAYLAYGFFK